MVEQCQAARVFVDAHVHIHPQFDLGRVLEAAWENFGRAGAAPEDLRVLMVADIGERRWCDRNGDPWQLRDTAEAYTLRACAHGREILVLLGCQVVTREGIEVLALGTEQRLADGLPLTATLEQAQVAQALPVLPWGVGKWLGKRGRLIRHQLAHGTIPAFCGDNSGRPNFWGWSPLLQAAQRQPRPLLPGTDPLPLDHEYCRPGKFGFILPGPLDSQRPGAALKQRLWEPGLQVRPYGSLESPVAFFWNQSMLRLQKVR